MAFISHNHQKSAIHINKTKNTISKEEPAVEEDTITKRPTGALKQESSKLQTKYFNNYFSK